MTKKKKKEEGILFYDPLFRKKPMQEAILKLLEKFAEAAKKSLKPKKEIERDFRKALNELDWEEEDKKTA